MRLPDAFSLIFPLNVISEMVHQAFKDAKYIIEERPLKVRFGFAHTLRFLLCSYSFIARLSTQPTGSPRVNSFSHFPTSYRPRRYWIFEQVKVAHRPCLLRRTEPSESLLELMISQRSNCALWEAMVLRISISVWAVFRLATASDSKVKVILYEVQNIF